MQNFKSGHIEEKEGFVVIDTNKWMRPKNAREELKNRGIEVSAALLHYWQENGKIQKKVIHSLDDMTLVNIDSIVANITEGH